LRTPHTCAILLNFLLEVLVKILRVLRPAGLDSGGWHPSRLGDPTNRADNVGFCCAPLPWEQSCGRATSHATAGFGTPDQNVGSPTTAKAIEPCYEVNPVGFGMYCIDSHFHYSKAGITGVRSVEVHVILQSRLRSPTYWVPNLNCYTTESSGALSNSADAPHRMSLVHFTNLQN
jgi:hypothetical protein